MPFHLLANAPAHSADDTLPALLRTALDSPLSALAIGTLLLIVFLVCLVAMVRKSAQLRRASTASARLLDAYRKAPHPLALLQFGDRFPASPLDTIYQAAGREIAYHLTGGGEVNHDFLMRLRSAAKIAPTQMKSVEMAARNAILNTQAKLESSLAVYSAVLSTLPWLGCLAPLLTYGEIRWRGLEGHSTPEILWAFAFAPAALALLGCIFAQLNYKLMVARVHRQERAMELFANTLQNDFDHSFVDHSRALEKLPSIDAFAMDGPSFSLPPTEAATRSASAT